MDGCARVILIILLCSVVASECLRRQKRIVGGRAAAQPPEDEPAVYITKNDRYATIYGTRDPDKGFYVFRGIRFGKPPVGRQRFQRPEPIHPEGEINATKWGPPCPQPSYTRSKIVGSEDCLFLNVFTPMLPDSSGGYPVLIWIHGGGFRRGSACQYEMRNLIKKKMVVVSIQYRLGSLGFLSTGTKELPGNNGMFDMILAVNWVKDYIEYFGGNPKNIIAFGHGTGASSAFMLSLSKLSRNTFNGLIAMSGSILSHFAIDKDPLKTAQDIASKNGCPTKDVLEMVRCLQELPVEKLIQVDSQLEVIRIGVQGFISGLSNILGAGPVIEGADDERSLPNLITETPEDSLKFGNFPEIPLLTGVMKDETTGAIFGGFREEVENKLRTVPNFLDKYLVPTLQSTISNFGNGSRFVPEAFSRYVNVIKNGNGDNDVSKVAEALGDSLYNVPAFLTVDHWSKKAKAFLYSFDHKGKKYCGKNFLAGLPIANRINTSNDITSHGDDLGYIFGQNTITGEKLENVDEDFNEEDESVMDIFTSMIANFARSGQLEIPTTSKNGSVLPRISPRFSSDSNPFISITSNPRTMTNFRYCEMGLWTGLTERLQSSACSLFKSSVDVIRHTAEKTVNIVEKPITSLEGVVPDFVPNTGTNNMSIRNRNENFGVDIIPQQKKSGAFPKLFKFANMPFAG